MTVQHSRITLFFIAMLCAWPALGQDQPQSKMVKQLDDFISQKVEEDVFSGTVLLAKNGKVLYTVARGMASKRFNVPNTLQTKFNLASMNKMFTATAIMQLVERGKLSLTDKLGQFVDESWLPKEISSQIEIQHLLTHASGLGSYFTGEFFKSSKNNFRLLEDYKPLIVQDTLKFKPGTEYSYSNNGMLLLGIVIETVSDSNYYNYIQKNIYKPSGMTNSGCYELDHPTPNLAIGYDSTDEAPTQWFNNYYWHPIKGGPAGGCYSTVEDVYNFAVALTGYKLLNENNTKVLYSPKPALHKEPYGYGFSLKGTPQNRIVGHRGGFVGMSSNLDIFLDTGYISVVLSNYGGGSISVFEKIRKLVQ